MQHVPIQVVGTVVSVSRRDVDKTAQNPKWIVDLVVRVDPDASTPDTLGASEIAFNAPERNLAGWISGVVKIGDRLRLEGHAELPVVSRVGIDRADRVGP